jgi:hypothetical protein
MARRFNRRPLTEQERDARRQADPERIEQAARALLTTDGWQRWIKVRASNGLSRYSLNNQCIILWRRRRIRTVGMCWCAGLAAGCREGCGGAR